MNTELEQIVQESGLVLSDAEEIKQSYLPYFVQIAEIKEQAKKIDFENPSDLDERIARELRLKTVKIRTGSEEVKNNRKKIYQLRANVEQSSWNLIKDTCLIDEETFAQVEKARERKEIARKEALKNERLTILAPYGFDSTYTDLANMTDEAFLNMLHGIKLAHDERLEAAAKLELERIAKEKAEAEERERIKLENERLKKEREAIEKAQIEERKKADELLQAERAKAEAAQRQANKEKAQQELKLKKEREAKEAAEAQIKAAADKVEADRIAKIKAEKEAAKAPDKTKLTIWIEGLELPELSLSEKESVSVEFEIRNKFSAFKTWAKNQVNGI